ncbi:MAG: cellulose synthase operon protein YhjQ/BcsQ [Pseudomonadota bacterium]
MAYVSSDAGARLARSVLTATGSSDPVLHGGGLSGAARVATARFAGKVILAELGTLSVEMACECLEELKDADADVIVLGDLDDLASYRRLRQAGALEYFSVTASADDILSTWPAPAAPLPEPHVDPIKSPSVAVVGCTGGVGASTLAQNFAVHLSALNRSPLKTALLDADLVFGTQAIDLDRDETRGFFEALMSPDRIDHTFISATMDQISDTLAFYSNHIHIGQSADQYEAGLMSLIPRLRDHFDLVVTDLPRTTLLKRAELATQFDVIALVLPPGFAGVNAATRLINQIKTESSDTLILPVLSDLRKDASLSVKDIEKTLGLSITAQLPRCDAALAKAQRAGVPLVQHQRKSSMAKPIEAIWKDVQRHRTDRKSDPSDTAPKSIFGRFFK